MVVETEFNKYYRYYYYGSSQNIINYDVELANQRMRMFIITELCICHYQDHSLLGTKVSLVELSYLELLFPGANSAQNESLCNDSERSVHGNFILKKFSVVSIR